MRTAAKLWCGAVFSICGKKSRHDKISVGEIKTTCLQQTIHFQLKEDLTHGYAVEAVQAEYAPYKQQFECKHIERKMVDENTRPDGSILNSTKRITAGTIWTEPRWERGKGVFSRVSLTSNRAALTGAACILNRLKQRKEVFGCFKRGIVLYTAPPAFAG